MAANNVNILLITLDQFRGDCLSAAGHPVVRTPNLDRAGGRRACACARHYSQAAPCSPGRAALYTGTYQMNHRVVANGTPLDAASTTSPSPPAGPGTRRRCSATPTSASTHAIADGPDDPRLSTYEGVLPGFDSVLDLSRASTAVAGVARRARATTSPDGRCAALETEHERPGEHSLGAFLTDRRRRLDRGPADQPWFAHLSYLRPHPPYAARRRVVDERTTRPCRPMPIAPADRHPLARRCCCRSRRRRADRS